MSWERPERSVAAEDGFEEIGEVVSGELAGVEDVCVGERAGEASGPVGEAGEGGDLETGGASGDGFEDGGHPDGVSAERAEHADFGWGFVLGAAETGVDPLVERHADGGGGGGERGAP